VGVGLYNPPVVSLMVPEEKTLFCTLKRTRTIMSKRLLPALLSEGRLRSKIVAFRR
jgi:hypothetical protein